MPPLNDRDAHRERIIAGLRGRSLEEALDDPALRADLEEEARSPEHDRLVHPDLLRVVEQARTVRLREPNLGLFFSSDDVIIVPGFLGSELVDLTGGNGLIWIDPKLVFSTGQLLALRLKAFVQGQPDADATAGVSIAANGAIPLIYGGLKYDLAVRRYDPQIFGFDWRKNIDQSAESLAGLIRERAHRSFRPLHLIAHSQGTVVARRALQLLGADLSRQLVNNLVLLGPATAGTFSAAFALAGNHSLLEVVRRYGIEAPDGFTGVLQSMSGLYQLLPWRTEAVDGQSGDKALEWVAQNREAFRKPAFWATGVDPERLEKLFGWGDRVDSSFFNDRTTIILGDHPTVGGVRFVDGALVADCAFATQGDGTVPDSLARVAGVTRVYRARGVEHMMLPATLSVIVAVRDVLAGRLPRVDRALPAAGDIPFLAAPAEEPPPRARPVPATPAEVTAVPPVAAAGRMPAQDRPVPAPQNRRLRVFSFDPLLGTDLDALGTEQLTLSLPWSDLDGDQLQPGPVGEYLEVVDYDPANQCFYPPIDLNHPHLLAQDGLPVSEGDPRFHQQMAYAVAMNTIHHFESALGRVALWAPHLPRDKDGEVVKGLRPEDEFVQRLRIYPHAMRQANAYYHPERKALLFGYFPALGRDVGRNLPGGMIFSSLSFDIIAHETTHALLDGLHRYFTEPSNPDVFAFHEAFADVVALFEHFSHPEVLWYQLARSRGDLRQESMLGVLAAQFGEALGKRGALRQYLGRRKDDGKWEPITPDPMAVGHVWEPHDRGAILVAALFRAFTNIYENRVQDLRRIATGGTGVLPDGDLHPDLVTRMAAEAARASGHMLNMCVRALDYIPPIDITFGEYLRALITADYDLVRDDDRRYRVSVLSAFRDWGIYPSDVRSLSVDSLLWNPPEPGAFREIRNFLETVRFSDWDLSCDRRKTYEQMHQNNQRFHTWLAAHVGDGRDLLLGLSLGPKTPGSIPRNDQNVPKFEVHSFRPCRRIGPDGQERSDVLVEVVQRRKAFFDRELQKKVDGGQEADARPDFYFRGGCTLIIDPETGDLRYCIRKSVCDDSRLDEERRFRQGQFGDRVGGIYLQDGAGMSPFAFLHGGR
jgi:hypothetical protein